jgi:hypothetical protein
MKWTLKLAKAAAAAFADASAAYRRRTGLEAYAADADDWSASIQCKQHVHGHAWGMAANQALHQRLPHMLTLGRLLPLRGPRCIFCGRR